jgi:LSD1 subclass zinc finger protein
MVAYYRCTSCRSVFPLMEGAKEKCAKCGATGGEVLSAEHFKAGFDAGTYYNLDPKTGGRAKAKRGKKR